MRFLAKNMCLPQYGNDLRKNAISPEHVFICKLYICVHCTYKYTQRVPIYNSNRVQTM